MDTYKLEVKGNTFYATNTVTGEEWKVSTKDVRYTDNRDNSIDYYDTQKIQPLLQLEFGKIQDNTGTLFNSIQDLTDWNDASLGKANASTGVTTIKSFFQVSASATNKNKWIGHTGKGADLELYGRLSVFSEQDKTIFIHKGYQYGITEHIFDNLTLTDINVSIQDVGTATFDANPSIELIVWVNEIVDNTIYNGLANAKGVIIYNETLTIDNTYSNRQYKRDITGLNITIPKGKYISYAFIQVNFYSGFYGGLISLKLK